jgi:signal transduction histidine kinase
VPPERLPSIGQIVGQSARRIGELIDNLLDFTRGRLGGGIHVTRIRLQTLEPVLDAVVTELRAAYPSHMIESRFHFTAPVAADPNRIAQMVSNLLANAVIHGDPSKPIRIEGTCDVDLLVISVANGGNPIPKDIMSKLFKPFERGTKNGDREGLGLGLYICSEIAKAHGGELTATSTGEETVFRFVMPQGG